MTPYTIRNLEEKDNAAMAKIIRDTLEEFRANKPGTVYFDPTTDNLSALFETPQSRYFIAEQEGRVVGGAGIYPTKNLPDQTCELVKLYLHQSARGQGLGKLLLQKCIDEALSCGYRKMYLETMPELIIAIPLYEKFGFTYIPSALGESCHTGCDIWMIRDL
jgi:putative acetyltransferase